MAWIVPRIASTHEIACYARTGEVNPRNRDYVSGWDGWQLPGTPAPSWCYLVGKLAGRTSLGRSGNSRTCMSKSQHVRGARNAFVVQYYLSINFSPS